jgi:hypothetical protein
MKQHSNKIHGFILSGCREMLLLVSLTAHEPRRLLLYCVAAFLLISLTGCASTDPAHDIGRLSASDVAQATTKMDATTDLSALAAMSVTSPNQSLREKAKARISAIINNSENISDLFVATQLPNLPQVEARNRIAFLLGKWGAEGAADKITYLLETARTIKASPNSLPIADSPMQPFDLRGSILTCINGIATNSFEQITDDDYSRAVSYKGTSFPLTLKLYRHDEKLPPLRCLDLFIYQVGRDSFFKPSLGKTIDGLVTDTIVAEGVTYKRSIYSSVNVTLELVRREGESSNKAVSTQILTVGTIHYRLSKIEGF